MSRGAPTESGRAIAAKVRELRQARGLTQQQLADKLGSTQPAIAALEAGEVRTLNLATWERIADALDATFVAGIVTRDEALTTGVPIVVKAPRNRCGYVFPSIDRRGRICNRVAGHAGQHRAVFESESPPNIWD
jgi:transcriptional regulator with XRE-family HTH domain